MVPFARLERGTDILALLTRKGFTPQALSLAGSTPLAQLARPPRSAILLGAEGRVCPLEVLARAQTISIPLASGFDFAVFPASISLNAKKIHVFRSPTTVMSDSGIREIAGR